MTKSSFKKWRKTTIQRRQKKLFFGFFNRAVEFYQKALAIDEALGRKAGIANKYGNLGFVYKRQDNPVEAKRYWKMSLKLFKEIGSPNAQRVQSWLDGLAEVKQ